MEDKIKTKLLALPQSTIDFFAKYDNDQHRYFHFSKNNMEHILNLLASGKVKLTKVRPK